MNRPDVLALFAAQHWVAAWRQLPQLGVTRSTLSRARQRGLVTSPVRGVVAVAGVELSLAGRALAAQLAAGSEAFVSGPTAGALHGLRDMPRQRIEVTIPEHRRVTLPPGHRLVRTSWIDEPRDVDEPSRRHPARLAAAHAVRARRAVQPAPLRARRRGRVAQGSRDAGPGRRVPGGDPPLRPDRRHPHGDVAGADRHPPGADAAAERARAGVRRHDRTCRPADARCASIRSCSPTGELIHLDLAWIDVRLAVEPGHSWWHGGDLRQRRDQDRDRACAVVGWHVVRYDETAAAGSGGDGSGAAGAVPPPPGRSPRFFGSPRRAERERGASETVRRGRR